MSDCGAIQDFHRFHQITDTPEDSAALAIESGCDLNCGLTYAFLMKAYEQGKVSEEAIRRAAVRLFTTRFLLGILGGSEFDRIGYRRSRRLSTFKGRIRRRLRAACCSKTTACCRSTQTR